MTINWGRTRKTLCIPRITPALSAVPFPFPLPCPLTLLGLAPEDWVKARFRCGDLEFGVPALNDRSCKASSSNSSECRRMTVDPLVVGIRSVWMTSGVKPCPPDILPSDLNESSGPKFESWSELRSWIFNGSSIRGA